VTEKYYPGGRHEMLNEINRDEVLKDFLSWSPRVCVWRENRTSRFLVIE